MRQRDPQVLWRRFGAGDRAAFADLYERHQQDVYRYCRSLLHHEDDARDAAHSTWMAVWTTPHAARRGVPMRPWLFRIAHNESIDLLRRRRPDQELAAAHEIAAPDDLAADLDLRERLATLRADLLSLSERQRSALLLREMAGLSHQEIAATLHISARAAKQTIYEARQALADTEGGRSMACDSVQRAISAGDRRVRRGRGLRAHLRGCAACQTFASAIDEQGRDLRILVPALPAPAAAALLARLGSGVGAASGGGAASASGGALGAVGAKLGSSVAAKIAVAAAVVAVGTGGEQFVVPKAGGERAIRAHTASEASPSAATAISAQRPVSSPAVPAAVGRSSANATHTGTGVTTASHEPPASSSAPPVADPPATPAVPAGETPPGPSATTIAPAVQPDETTAVSGHGEAKAGHGEARGKAAAPGQIKSKSKSKDTDTDTDTDTTVPGDADAAPSPGTPAPAAPPAPTTKIPPGQAKKSDPTATQDDTNDITAKQADGATKGEPPGQAKK
jgi:RNA polymerase sigma factor (sigma-70 family)